MQNGAHCARHAERPAALACARCGTFICTGCVVSGDLCAPCKSRLLREGVPYSAEERARASARSWLRIGSWTLRIELGAGGGSALLLAGTIGGIFPAGLRSLGLGLGALAIVLGAVAVFAAVLGYRSSLRGRPGPAVDGIFPAPAALLMVGVGLLPGALGLFALTRGWWGG